MLASIPASTSAASSAWSVHSSSARAGAHGALVSAVPLEAFQEAFDRCLDGRLMLSMQAYVRCGDVGCRRLDFPPL